MKRIRLVSDSSKELGTIKISRIHVFECLAEASKPLTLFSSLRDRERTMSALPIEVNRATFDRHISIIEGNIYKR